MLIIMEGCDGVGKSYVVERLRAALEITAPVTVLHKGPMTDHAIAEYEYPLEDYEPGNDQHIICDRWHVGELVYGPLLRGQARMSEAERRHIDKFLAARGALVIHASAPQSLIRQRLGTRGDDLVDGTLVERIVDAYHNVLTGLHWCTATYNTILTGNDDKDRDTIRGVITAASFITDRTRYLRRFRTYVGPPDPRFLLLGERRNAAKANVRAAFVPISGTSGAYLLRALTPDVCSQAGIANACEEDLSELWPSLGQPLVIALGRDAERECETAEIPHGTVPHPQFIRRFHNARIDDYGRAIREAALHGKDMSHAFGPARS